MGHDVKANCPKGAQGSRLNQAEAVPLLLLAFTILWAGPALGQELYVFRRG